MSKQIFIAEIKTRSPYGFVSKHSMGTLIEWAVKYGDWIAVHTNPMWGGDYDDIRKLRKLTKKPILAKGPHTQDFEVKACLDRGADYVLTINGSIPDDHKLLNKCIVEVNGLYQLECADMLIPDQKVLWNARDLMTGKPRVKDPRMAKREKKRIGVRYGLWEDARDTFKGWMCQASFIKTPKDIQKDASAFIVGQNLIEFIQAKYRK